MIAIRILETLGHLHAWSVELTWKRAGEILAASSTSSHMLPIDTHRVTPDKAVREWMADSGHLNANLYEVAGGGSAYCEGRRTVLHLMVKNQAIVIPATIDAIGALAGRQRDPAVSIASTNETFGIAALECGDGAAQAK